MIAKSAAKTKYAKQIDPDILEAFLSSFGDLINEKELDSQLSYLVIPVDIHQPGRRASGEMVNRTYPEIALSFGRSEHVSFGYTNKFKGRMISLVAESLSAAFCQVLAPTRSFPVRLVSGQATRVRLVFQSNTQTCSGFFSIVEIRLKDAFTGRLLERLHFPVVIN